MTTLAAPPATGTRNAALNARQRRIREGALILIRSGEPADSLPLDPESVAEIAADIAWLRAQGVGPARAEVLYSHHMAGRSFRVISGGGETTDAPRPALRVLAGAR